MDRLALIEGISYELEQTWSYGIAFEFFIIGKYLLEPMDLASVHNGQIFVGWYEIVQKFFARQLLGPVICQHVCARPIVIINGCDIIRNHRFIFWVNWLP